MNAFVKLSVNELRLMLREPMLAFFGLVFPSLLLVILGSIPDFRVSNPDIGGLRVVDLYVPILIVTVLAMLGIQGTPAVLGTYRERGVLRRLATTPASPLLLIGAQLVTTFVMALFSSTLVLLVGRFAFDVAFPGHPLLYLVSFLLCAGAVFAIGVFVAAVAPSAKAANGIGAVLFFPLMFFAGLWTPREVMPDVLQRIGEVTPLGAGQAAMQAASTGHWPTPLAVITMLAYLGLFTAGAVRFFRWQ